MKKELEFLHIREGYTYKEAFLQHITELIQIRVKPADTHEGLFNKIREYFKNNPEKLEVTESWIQFQYDGMTDKDIFKKTKVLQRGTKGKEMIAVFNMFNL